MQYVVPALPAYSLTIMVLNIGNYKNMNIISYGITLSYPAPTPPHLQSQKSIEV